jgi:hypothetical protein
VTAIATTPALLPAVSGPRWPLFIAPLVGLIYYLAICAAFQTAIGDVVPNTSDLDISPDAAPTKWASHWIYRLIAEAAAVTFGTFIAAGMARQRAAIAGLIGGFGISLWWTVHLTVIVLAQSTLKGSEALNLGTNTPLVRVRASRRRLWATLLELPPQKSRHGNRLAFQVFPEHTSSGFGSRPIGMPQQLFLQSSRSILTV